MDVASSDGRWKPETNGLMRVCADLCVCCAHVPVHVCDMQILFLCLCLRPLKCTFSVCQSWVKHLGWCQKALVPNKEGNPLSPPPPSSARRLSPQCASTHSSFFCVFPPQMILTGEEKAEHDCWFVPALLSCVSTVFVPCTHEAPQREWSGDEKKAGGSHRGPAPGPWTASTEYLLPLLVRLLQVFVVSKPYVWPLPPIIYIWGVYLYRCENEADNLQKKPTIKLLHRSWSKTKKIWARRRALPLSITLAYGLQNVRTAKKQLKAVYPLSLVAVLTSLITHGQLYWQGKTVVMQREGERFWLAHTLA